VHQDTSLFIHWSSITSTFCLTVKLTCLAFVPSVWVMLVGLGLGAWLFLFLGYLFLLLGPASYCVWLINSFCISLSLCLSSPGFPPCPSLSIEATNGSTFCINFDWETYEFSNGMNFQLDLSLIGKPMKESLW
jgi:hypothetical protein